MVSSEQDGVVVWVLYPLEQCRESLLLLEASEFNAPSVNPSWSRAEQD